MLTKSLLWRLVANDALTRGLGDPEARILVEWLVEQAELAAENPVADAGLAGFVDRLCRRGRAIGRFVSLLCHRNNPGGAHQLAAAEGFCWPFPPPQTDPCEVMIS